MDALNQLLSKEGPLYERLRSRKTLLSVFVDIADLQVEEIVS